MIIVRKSGLDNKFVKPIQTWPDHQSPMYDPQLPSNPTVINILAYADDIVLIAPSWRALQHLLNIAAQQSTEINMVLNANKSVCMVFPSRDRSTVVSSSFPPLCVGNDLLHFVHVLSI